MPKLPPALQGIFFDFVWDKAKVWALPTAAEPGSVAELAWHLDLPVWSTVIGQARFDLSPATVLAHPQQHSAHWQRIQQADFGYPLELFRNVHRRWVILDGYHRLARCVTLHQDTVWVRLHPDDFLASVICG